MNPNGDTFELENPPSRPVQLSPPHQPQLEKARNDAEAIERLYKLNAKFEEQFAPKLKLETALSRQMVSFQANKTRAIYRWYKYKEGFSAGLVEYFVDKCNIGKGKSLDPFAGSGTTMFATGNLGMQAEGIELLPIGQRIIDTKQLIEHEITPHDIKDLTRWTQQAPWRNATQFVPINELRITKGAYPKETFELIGKYMAAAEEENNRVRRVLSFALLCILESISYTRKDGQYLRWDYRSGRRQGKKRFDKGDVLPFETAISEKLAHILSDLRDLENPVELFTPHQQKSNILLHANSCLDILPTLRRDTYDCIITSPPYCNRYDYTRTYALELALLGVQEDELLRLRQEMLSCTVENRAKNLLQKNPKWQNAIQAANDQELLQGILHYLDTENEHERLNNTGIPRMVRGYFYEMSCVIADCARVLKKHAPLIMVNDNVRYAGVGVSVDIILSDIAGKLGFDIESILILPNGKGNSSQQMGVHGREPLRKCVYVWRKT